MCVFLLASMSGHAAYASKAMLSPADTHQHALELFNQKKFRSAAQKWEDLEPYVQGTVLGIETLYYQGCCAFERGNYEEAFGFFETFYNTYPLEIHTEAAYAKAALARYYTTPPLEVDPTLCDLTLQALQGYLSRYPQGIYQEKVQKAYAKLEVQHAAHTIYVAKTYYHLGAYKAALHVLEDFEQSFPDNSQLPYAQYWRVRIAYQAMQEAASPLAYVNDVLDYCQAFLCTQSTNPTATKQIRQVKKYQQKTLRIFERSKP